MKTVILVPTYNETENIPLLADQVATALPEAAMLLLDDNSPDGTADAAEQLFRSNPRFSQYQVVRRTGPRGLGRAYRDGFLRALDLGYDRIFQMDADLSHDPSHLPAMLRASHSADLVIGSRYCPGGGVRNWPASRVRLSRFANWYVHKIASIPISDATAGFRCWTRRAVEAIEVQTLESEGYSFQVEISHRAYRAGMRIVESPITFTDRQYGRSKISRAVMIESFLMPWKLRLRPWQPSCAALGAVVPDAALQSSPRK